MKISRLLLPLFFAFSLLAAQQAGAAHTLHHALEQAQDKQAPHSIVCEKCENYAQLGSALDADSYNPALLANSDETAPHRTITVPFPHFLPAVARGPPVSLRNIA